MDSISSDPPDPIIGWLASRIALAVRRLRRVPLSDWDDFLAHGRDGHPAWHYTDDGHGRMVLDPKFSGPAEHGADVQGSLNRDPCDAPVRNAGLRNTHRALLAYLIANHGRRSVSLLAREWGTRSGHSQRLADQLLRELERAGALKRTRRGSATTWRITQDHV